EALLVDLGRDREARARDDVGLSGGERAGSRHGVDRCGAERSGELTEPVGDRLVPRGNAVRHRRLVRGDTSAPTVRAHPEPDELGDLLLEGHVLDEVFDTLRRGPSGVLPGANRLGPLTIVVHVSPSLRPRRRGLSQVSPDSRNLSDTGTLGTARAQGNLLPRICTRRWSFVIRPCPARCRSSNVGPKL